MTFSATTDHSSSPSLAVCESTASDYFALLKPRVMSLVTFTGFVGMAVAPGFLDMHMLIAFTAILCLAIGAGAAGAFNMWYERRTDALMRRTQDRPLPKGRIDPADALAFAVTLSLLSVMTMGVAVNWLAAGLLAAANLYYVLVYTVWLKPRTPQNIVIGGAAGAFPPLIGWAAVTGEVAMLPILLFLVIFFWTPPHFWSLALFAHSDYERAKIPMLPAVRGERYTRRMMMAYTLLLIPLTVSPYVLGLTGALYGAAALALSGGFTYMNIKVLRETDGSYDAARRMFSYSVFYLFTLFLAVMIDAYLGLA